MKATTPFLFIAVLLLTLATLALAFSPVDIGSGFVLEIQTLQRASQEQLTSAVRIVQREGAAAATVLISLSFFYGLFHAAGPGHGKVVISTYILTQETQLRRGLLLSLVAALCQGLTAIVAVSATAGLLGLSLGASETAVAELEPLSYSLVALLGLTLVVERGCHLFRTRISPVHASGRPHVSQGSFSTPSADPCCSHVPVPSARELDAPLTFRSVAGVIASVGLRPCCGAVLVLLLAYSLDLYLTGTMAVLAMSLGTAVTVSVIACLSVFARERALDFARRTPNLPLHVGVTIDAIALLGGLVLLFLGLSMLRIALAVPHSIA